MGILVVAGKARCEWLKGVDQPGCFHQGERTQGRQTVWESTPVALGADLEGAGQYLPPQQPCFGSSMGSLCGAGLLSSYMLVFFSLPACLSPFCISTWAPSLRKLYFLGLYHLARQFHAVCLSLNPGPALTSSDQG